ncbi:putative N-acetyltransferase, MSMEG_0567 N-terminal domain family [Roseovarius sp. EC-HK134]|uniref:MSMEG_0567/Sll0786 family nitrogen starvation N-acetyltransferase n=1 Tax=Roseovarius TaxID=74030 RepID=UPI0009D91D9C|nr:MULTISPECIES: MSMEG_0567/Sll0786 family nitrogen starvation N-acetyltransferase [Roseovarius]MBW4974877.1 GNAT family N-acetyltransferase [Roseovarius mucosus]VVT28479.1 putative N-acetyltransferase, MSMEG_0567 N-terminal domain family [Roseovarius sp. EC-SD190]VVT28900.1 putative N-acetyltransferase, MSMEG_0567 N-terminal domain family [Roseovarius sp. EC-HK134]|tara:strand:+ start:3803 stop:4348 length:546 start_codon:yes stop_codon:yes gene_type:complete
MIIERPAAFVTPEFLIRQATAPWEIGAAASLRHRTFVTEQGIFADHDRDEIDRHALPLVAVSTMASEADEVVGTVRIHEADKDVWWGSRLAVAPEYRRVGRLGAELIRLAVGTAHGRGCKLFLAFVQMQNVPLFEKLNWTSLGQRDLHGHPHMKMRADLSKYPAIEDPARGWMALTRKTTG